VLSKILAAAVPAAVIGGLLSPAPEAARALPVPTPLADFEEYYHLDRDPMPHVNPRNYGYLPRSYEMPWLYHPLYAVERDPYPSPEGYGSARVGPNPPAAGHYDDGYDDDNWYFDFYSPPESVDLRKRANTTDLRWYDW
jgi:hypothetical protein